MTELLQTSRFLLRPFSIEDAQNLFDLDMDPRVHRYLGNHTVETLDQSQKILEDILQQYDRNGIGRWVIQDKETGSFIGWSGLKLEHEDGIGSYFDIGYRLKPEFWGQGIGMETANKWLKYGFEELELPEIVGVAHIGNQASNKILRKIGLKYRKHHYWEDMMCNWYSLTAEEYQEIKNS